MTDRDQAKSINARRVRNSLVIIAALIACFIVFDAHFRTRVPELMTVIPRPAQLETSHEH